MNAVKTLRQKTGWAWGPPHWGPHVVLELRLYGRGTPRKTAKEGAPGRGNR